MIFSLNAKLWISFGCSGRVRDEFRHGPKFRGGYLP